MKINLKVSDDETFLELNLEYQIYSFFSNRPEIIQSDLINCDSSNSIFSMKFANFLANDNIQWIVFNIIKACKINNEIIEIDDRIKVFITQELTKKERIFQKISDNYNQIMNISNQSVSLDKTALVDTFKEYEFQMDAALDIVKKKRSANFSSPGAGKTILSYMAVSSLFSKKEINDLIILGPISASNAWFTEWEIVMKRDFVNVDNLPNFDFSKSDHNVKRKNLDNLLSNDKLNIIFVNYHKLQIRDFLDDLNQIFKKRKFMLIIDEAHYLKNKKGIWHKNLLNFASLPEYSLLLTGTPLPKGIKEAYYIVNLLWPFINQRNLSEQKFESLGTRSSIKETTTYLDFKKIYTRKNKNDLVNTGQLKPLIARIEEIDISDLELLIVNNFRDSGFKNRLDDKIHENISKALLLRRMQASSYPPLLRTSIEDSIEELQKELSDNNSLDNVAEISEFEDNTLFDSPIKFTKDEEEINSFLEKIIEKSEVVNLIKKYESMDVVPNRWLKALEIINNNPNERIIVWDIFRKSMRDFRKYLNNNLKNRKILLINGEIKKEDRRNIIENFKRDKSSILIASPATIAESVSFHKECNVAIYLYKNFVGSHWMQSIDRIHRLLSPNETNSKEKYIFDIVSKNGSIDELISENLSMKVKEQADIID